MQDKAEIGAKFYAQCDKFIEMMTELKTICYGYLGAISIAKNCLELVSNEHQPQDQALYTSEARPYEVEKMEMVKC